MRDAVEFLEAARRGFEKAKGGDLVAARDAAEKAWNAVVQAVDALIMSMTGRRPRSHRERRDLLWEIEKRYPELEGIYDKYNARFQRLHGEMFYEGAIDLRDLEREIEKVEDMIRKIEVYVGRLRQ